MTERQEQNPGLPVAWVKAYTSVYLPRVDIALQTGSRPMLPGSLHLLSVVRDNSDHISNQLAWSNCFHFLVFF